MEVNLVIDDLNIHGSVRRFIGFANGLDSATIYTLSGEPCKWLDCKAEVKPLSEYLPADVDVAFTPNKSILHKLDSGLKCFYVLGAPEPNGEITSRILSGESNVSHVFLDDRWKILCNSTWIYEWVTGNLRQDAELLFGGIDFSLFHPVATNIKYDVLMSGDSRKRENTAHILYCIAEAEKMRGKPITHYSYFGKKHKQQEMKEVYCGARIFVDAQAYAGWNNPVAEAMACGVPVICSKMGGNRDFAAHKHTAYVVDNYFEYPDAIIEVLSNYVMYKTIANNAREHVQQYTWSEAIKNFYRIMESWV